MEKMKPFNMIIVGKTACGKTKYLLDTLENQYKNKFDYIILICPTFEHNTTYRNWKYESDEDYIVIPCDQDDTDSWLKYIVECYKGTNSLIILDDCASGKDVKSKTSELIKLGFSARHYGFSTIVITQQLTSIAKAYRENISKLQRVPRFHVTDCSYILQSKQKTICRKYSMIILVFPRKKKNT